MILRRPSYRSIELAAQDVAMAVISYGLSRWKSNTRLTLEQTLHKVINKSEGVGASELGFAWMSFSYSPQYDFASLDKHWQDVPFEDIPPLTMSRLYLGHEIELEADLGHNSQVYVKKTINGREKVVSLRYNGQADELDQMGMDRLLPREFFEQCFKPESDFLVGTEYADWMLKSGMVPGQRMLIMTGTSFHTDYWGESDSEAWGVALYASPGEISMDEFSKALEVKELFPA